MLQGITKFMVKRFFANYLTALLLLVLATVAPPAFAEEEYAVKAAFIVNFTKFVEWPEAKAINKYNKIDVCVLGDSDILNSLQIFKQASTSKLSIALVKENNLGNVSAHCHILFISSSEESRLDEIFSVLKDQPVLTIGDFENFSERGGMMGFVIVNEDNVRKIKFIVNKKAATSAGLNIDSQLLEIALKVI